MIFNIEIIKHRGRKIIVRSYSGKKDKVKEAIDVLMKGYELKDK
ncbi:hypothetical protein [Clostridium chrysemydis]|nr:hypothetical protein [Clostridium chrysemydis]